MITQTHTINITSLGKMGTSLNAIQLEQSFEENIWNIRKFDVSQSFGFKPLSVIFETESIDYNHTLIFNEDLKIKFEGIKTINIKQFFVDLPF